VRTAVFAVLLISTARAADVPFYPRGIETSKDVSGINENFRSVVGDLTKLRADLDANTASIAAISTGTGAAFLATTQQFTGGNSFTNSTTFYGQVYGNVAPRILIASATVAAVTSFSFPVTNSARQAYYAVWKATQNTSTGDFGITFNADTGANYSYHGRCENSGGASAVPTGTTGDMVFFDEQTTNRLTAQSIFKGHAWIYMGDGTDYPQVYGNNNIRLGAGTTYISCANGGSWRSVAAVTTIEMRVNVGTFTGKVFLYTGEAYP
jgi:hypothetical protein